MCTRTGTGSSTSHIAYRISLTLDRGRIAEVVSKRTMTDNHKVYTEEHMALVRHNDEIAVVTCDTTKGTMIWELYRYWSPAGYDRLVHLLENRFFDNTHFFRAVPHFLVQFGISYTTDTALQQLEQQNIPDDPIHDPPIPFTLGTISYAGKLKFQLLPIVLLRLPYI